MNILPQLQEITSLLRPFGIRPQELRRAFSILDILIESAGEEELRGLLLSARKELRSMEGERDLDRKQQHKRNAHQSIMEARHLLNEHTQAIEEGLEVLRSIYNTDFEERTAYALREGENLTEDDISLYKHLHSLWVERKQRIVEVIHSSHMYMVRNGGRERSFLSLMNLLEDALREEEIFYRSLEVGVVDRDTFLLGESVEVLLQRLHQNLLAVVVDIESFLSDP